MTDPANTCDLPDCSNPRKLGYLDKGVCFPCFSKYERDELREKLGIAKDPSGKAPEEVKG